MKNKLERKFGLLTAICMVVGIVIGSGVFFKAQAILNLTDGNMPLGILAWVIGGIVMLICALNFSNLATRYENVNGIVDYSEATIGGKYAYCVGWFITTIYYPAMTSVLAWVSARYTLVAFGSDDITGGLCLALAAFYLCASYFINALAPKLAGKFQVSTTVIKFIPIAAMAIIGLIVGLINGNTVNAFSSASITYENSSPLFAAVVATAFAYEGWIIATSINSELKNGKKNLPIALTIGGVIIAATYILYYIGLAGATTVDVLREQGSNAAFVTLFGNVTGTIFNVFVAVSCLGTLNGLMFASTRGMYAMAVRETGPRPDVFSEVSPTTNMPHNSSIVGVFLCAIWLFYFYGANLMAPLFGVFSFDSSELPIITIYAFYIPIFIKFAILHGKENIFKNIVMPILGVLSSLFMVGAAIYAHGVQKYQMAAAEGKFDFPVLFYLIVFAVIMAVGIVLYKKRECVCKIFDKKKPEQVQSETENTETDEDK